jgi:hypothetical protein
MRDFESRYSLYWGDLHNHNAVGYAKGSLARSIDVAREHLDFFAFTGHASWHDMPRMPGDRHMHWVNGFKTHREHWPETRRMIREASTTDFVSLLGYEWHSSSFGDYCLVFPEDQPELYLPDHVEPLLDFAQSKGALAIPHHVAYREGWRGANWRNFRASVTPVVEIFSEQGCTLSDRSPYPMILHSNGGRVTSQTVRFQLARGLRFGFVASTDDHFGYPGAYGEGVVGVWAEDLTPAAIFNALRARRTVAATGDRIRLVVLANGQPMGSELASSEKRVFAVKAEAPDSIESVELVRDGRVIRRHFPEDHARSGAGLPGRARCRVQYGWGPWAALDLERVCEWDFSIGIEGGRFLGIERCFQSGPFGEQIVDHARFASNRSLDVHSFTSRRQAYLQDPTKAIVCDIEAEADAHLLLELRKPVALNRRIPLASLVGENEVTFTGVFTSESVCVHRLVFPEETSCRVRWEESSAGASRGGPGGGFQGVEDRSDCYYVRVRLHNGQYAWSSPVWFG